jgi:hypothetical protein
MSWSDSGNGSGFSRIASIAENTALLAPMPSASDTIAMAVTNGCFRIERNAYLNFIAALPSYEVIETERRKTVT